MSPRRALEAAARRAGLALGCVAAAILLIAGIVRLLGGDPVAALIAIHRGSLAEPRSLTETLIRATPLVLTGLSVAVAFRCGIWNIGAEGQFLVGMLGSTLAALALPPMAPWLGVSVCLAAGALFGAAWAALATLLKLYRGVSEVISTIMLNFLAVFLLEYLVRGPMRDRTSIDDVSPVIPEWVRLTRFSRLWGVGEIGAGSIKLPNGQPVFALGVDAGYLHGGVLLALACVLVMGLWLAWSGAGFRIRAVGLNPAASAANRISVPATVWTAFLTSGLLAGLAGGVEQLATVSRLHHYAAGEPGYGFSGIAVALLGGLQPGGVLAAALFFGALRAGCDQMQRSAGISYYVAYVIQACLVLLILAAPRIKARSRAIANSADEDDS